MKLYFDLNGVKSVASVRPAFEWVGGKCIEKGWVMDDGAEITPEQALTWGLYKIKSGRNEWTVTS